MDQAETPEGPPLSAAKRSLVVLNRLQTRLAEVELRQREPIAIVGVGCRFPQAHGREALWDLLTGEVDAIRAIDRWDIGLMPLGHGPEGRHAGLTEDVDLFDADFFGISPREAAMLDPQQRLLLETSWEAMEDAAICCAGKRGGVFIGVGGSEYSYLQLRVGRVDDISIYTGTGTAMCFAAGRVAHAFDLNGPAFVVETACSSSLVATHLAIQSLRRGECDLALAGGVSIILSPEPAIFLSRSGALSRRGQCRSFDVDADGFVRGEGCGVVVLKRLSDARAAGDRIVAVIRGSAVNHDGRSGGLTVPNGAAQQRVIRAALADAGVSGDAIGYVEAHGTGTVLGDPIEARALGAVLGAGRPSGPGERLIVGSVKTNIGHLEAAAGVAGLIKAALVVNKGAIPAHLHFKAINPHIDLAETPIAIPTTLTPWPEGRPRLAGVSSFGLSGTNAHVILEAPPAEAMDIGDEAVVNGSASAGPCWHVLPLSARDGTALAQLARNWAQALEQEGVAVADLCHTAAAGRARFAERLAVTGADAPALAQGLRAASAGEGGIRIARERLGAGRPRLAFLFTGQGAQRAGMGLALARSEPLFAAALQRAAAALAEEMDPGLMAVLGDGSLLADTAHAQPALVALECALADQWRAWGIEPAVVLGHSVGEYAAAYAAGMIALEDAVRLAARRGRLMRELTALGAMAAVTATPEAAAAAIAGIADLCIAANNGPERLTLAGTPQAIEQALAALAAANLPARRLDVSRAFHSPLMEPMLPAFAQVLATQHWALPRMSFISSMTGQPADNARLSDPAYWVEQLRAPVAFAEACRSLRDMGATACLELGPAPTLLALARENNPDLPLALAASLRPGTDEPLAMRIAASHLWTAGFEPQWNAINPKGKTTSAPHYPFQRKRHWIESVPTVGAQAPDDWFYAIQWREAAKSAQTPRDEQSGLAVLDTGSSARIAAQALNARLLGTGDLDAALAQPDFATLLWVPEEPDATSPAEAARLACGKMLDLVQRTTGAGGVRLWVLTRGAQAAIDGEAPQLWAAPLWGLGRVAALEHPESWGGLIDLEPGTEPTPALLALLRGTGGEDQIAMRAGKPLVARLVRTPPTPAAKPLALNPDATYLVTGGIGGIGLKLAQWISQMGGKHLLLTSRRGLAEGASGARTAIEQIEAAGTRVTVLAADASDEAKMCAAIAACAQAGRPVRGVFHLAAHMGMVALGDMTVDDLAASFAGKASGAWSLHRALATTPLDIFVCFSSTAAAWGAGGLGHYAASNQFLDAFAAWRRTQGLLTTVVDWGSWDTIGAAAAEERAMIERFGMLPLLSSAALAELGRMIASDRIEGIVAAVNWRVLLPIYTFKRARPFFADVAAPRDEQASAEAAAAAAQLRSDLQALSPLQQQGKLLDLVAGAAVAVLGHPPDARLDVRAGLFDLGFDSLLAVEFKTSLERATGLNMPATVIFSHPTLEAIARYLWHDLLPEQAQLKAHKRTPEAPLENLSALADSELSAALEDEFAAAMAVLNGNEGESRPRGGHG